MKKKKQIKKDSEYIKSLREIYEKICEMQKNLNLETENEKENKL